ncbi:MAG: tRNA lysidine(34) synthetase TilS, partial [Lautropia sp.]|nr:tRNA lysidine(34) synthetase TilS [Lautropia sp.]
MLPDLILAAIRKHQPSGSPPILLACSGGVDSQVLLHAAAQVWPAPAIFVAHVHHGLQPEADDWLAFCRATAGGLGLPFLSRRLPPLPDRIAGGVEAWARRLRYQALADMAQAAGARLVLTAHHADDQLETYRLRRLRGAGPLGLGAMRDSAPMPGAPDRLLLRPFLGLAKQQILEHAQAHHLEWVDDPSNQDLRYARNRVRKELAQELLRDPVGLQRSVTAIGEFQSLADAAMRQARVDLAACSLMLPEPDARWREAGTSQTPGVALLSRASLARLPAGRAGEALRLWLRDAGRRMP